VRFSTKVPFTFFGGSISFTVFLFSGVLVSLGFWKAWEIVGNGRSAREDGNEVFLLGITRWVAAPTPRDELASGEEMAGRDIVMVAEKNLLVIGCKSI